MVEILRTKNYITDGVTIVVSLYSSLRIRDSVSVVICVLPTE
jgi:hypothetical protein